jgi:D-inositol-3-phosphate glycosyltransferase
VTLGAPNAPARIALLSLHTSPLAQPGSGDSGGMNVYIRELVGHLAHTGAMCHVYVRAWHPDLPAEVDLEPGVRVIHIPAGPYNLAKEELYDIVDEFADKVEADIMAQGGVDVLHANYWLSGVAGHRIKHRLDIPLVTTFHTLARVKAETGDHEPERRAQAEAQVIACSDAVTASCVAEANWLKRLYGTPAERISYVVPGVEHAIFSPGMQSAAREAVGLDDKPTVLFVGRIQPLKGVSVAAEALGRMKNKEARLVIVGGPSGREGEQELALVKQAIANYGLEDRVRFEKPVPHHLLSSWYRAADICIVPSRSESFGLVALEAAACGTPVVASSVGGLRTLVDHGKTGFLVAVLDPSVFSTYMDQIFSHPMLAAELAMASFERARNYRWSTTALHLRDLYSQLAVRESVNC